MSGNEGARLLGQALGEAIGDTFVKPARKFRATPEGPQKNRTRASWGTGLIAGGVDVVHTKQVSMDANLAELTNFYVRSFQKPLDYSWPFYALAAVMLFGLIWVMAGLRGSRGPRDIMGAFWAIARIAGFGAALWYGWYLNGYPYVNWCLQGIYIIAVSASVMALFLALRGSGRGAVRLVQQQIARQERSFRVGRQRSF